MPRIKPGASQKSPMLGKSTQQQRHWRSADKSRFYVDFQDGRRQVWRSKGKDMPITVVLHF